MTDEEAVLSEHSRALLAEILAEFSLSRSEQAALYGGLVALDLARRAEQIVREEGAVFQRQIRAIATPSRGRCGARFSPGVH